MRANRVLGILPGVAGFAFAPQALADDEPIRFEYVVPAECPDQATFLAQVRARTRRWRDAVGDEPARRFVVEVGEGEGRGVRARLTVKESGATGTPREILAPRCDEAVKGIAIVAALAIDPSASTSPIVDAGAPPSSSSSPVAPSAKSTPVVRTAAPRPSRATLGLGVRAEFVGQLPRFTLGGGAFVELAFARAGWPSPALRASFRYAQTSPLPIETATAQLDLATVGLEACPLRLPLAHGLFARPCVGVESGWLRATGANAHNAHTEGDDWSSGQLTGRLEWAIGRSVWVEGQGGATFPFRHTEFHFDPGVSVYKVPAAAGTAAAGVGVRFP